MRRANAPAWSRLVAPSSARDTSRPIVPSQCAAMNARQLCPIARPIAPVWPHNGRSPSRCVWFGGYGGVAAWLAGETYAHTNFRVFFNWPFWPLTAPQFYRSTLCVSTRYPALRFPRLLTASPPSAHSMKSSISSSKRVSRTAWAASSTFCSIDLM